MISDISANEQDIGDEYGESHDWKDQYTHGVTGIEVSKWPDSFFLEQK